MLNNLTISAVMPTNCSVVPPCEVKITTGMLPTMKMGARWNFISMNNKTNCLYTFRITEKEFERDFGKKKDHLYQYQVGFIIKKLKLIEKLVKKYQKENKCCQH